MSFQNTALASVSRANLPITLAAGPLRSMSGAPMTPRLACRLRNDCASHQRAAPPGGRAFGGFSAGLSSSWTYRQITGTPAFATPGVVPVNAIVSKNRQIWAVLGVICMTTRSTGKFLPALALRLGTKAVICAVLLIAMNTALVVGAAYWSLTSAFGERAQKDIE